MAPTTTHEIVEINGEQIAYQLTLSRTDHNRRWSATISFDGHEKYISQNLLVDDPGSEDAMKGLAEMAMSSLYLELHPDRT